MRSAFLRDDFAPDRVEWFLFDLDGTLVDSSPVHAAAFAEVLEMHDKSCLDRFDYSDFRGRATGEVFAELLGGTPARWGALTEQKRASYRRRVTEGEVGLCPGARDFIEFVRESGRRSQVVTSASKGSAHAVLSSLDLFEAFHSVVTADDVARAKPEPDLFLEALRRSGASGKRCLTVEDSVAGAAASEAAGIPVVLVHGEKERGVASDVPTLRELIEIFDGAN